MDREPEDDYELGNGDVPPQWGIDFVVFGGTMTYGPWADRQRYALRSLLGRPLLRLWKSDRVAFNQAFLPSIFYHTPQTERLKPGDLRKHVSMDVDVEIREATTWRMPTRESSKVSLQKVTALPPPLLTVVFRIGCTITLPRKPRRTRLESMVGSTSPLVPDQPFTTRSRSQRKSRASRPSCCLTWPAFASCRASIIPSF